MVPPTFLSVFHVSLQLIVLHVFLWSNNYLLPLLIKTLTCTKAGCTISEPTVNRAGKQLEWKIGAKFCNANSSFTIYNSCTLDRSGHHLPRAACAFGHWMLSINSFLQVLLNIGPTFPLQEGWTGQSFFLFLLSKVVRMACVLKYGSGKFAFLRNRANHIVV